MTDTHENTSYGRSLPPEDADDETEQAARKIGTEHGSAAASWVELDEQTAQAIDAGRLGVFEAFDGMSGPLSGEWADGYSVEQLAFDCGVNDAGNDNPEADWDDLASAYEDAYWQAFEAEVERKVETLRGPVPKIDTSGTYVGPGPGKVAWRVVGFTFGGLVRAVMVGDDREHTFDVDELTQIDDDAYCAECGQVGCTADGRDRS